MVFKTEVSSIPDHVPYLFTPEQKKLEWANRLGQKTKPRIGLVWSGNKEHNNDYNRSIPLKSFLPFLDANAEFFSLQKEYRDNDYDLLKIEPRIKDFSHLLNDFSDTAALVEAMDLVISVDTSVAHLTGALGKPLWILLLYAADYRWLTGEERSPWYPSARFFKQHERNIWDGPIQRVKEEIPLHFNL